MRILKDIALEIRARNPNRIGNAIQDARVVDEVNGIYTLLVKWTLENVRRLANLGLSKGKVPSPILRDYHWPGEFTPYNHQKETASFLTANNRSYDFSEQGTGKTASAIWAADYLLTIGDISRVLIVCPLSIMQVAWGDDIFKTVMHRSVMIAHGAREKREKIIQSGAEFTVINFDGVHIVADLLKTMNYDLIIVDEANAIKTATTRRWKALNKVISPDARVWMLTGTPAAQSPVDAYGLAKMNTPQRVPKYFTAWRDKVMYRLTQFKWVPVPKATELVHQALQPAIRHTKAECLDLPLMTYQTRDVPLTAQQKKYYGLLKTQMRVEAAGERITAVHAAAGIIKLLQISQGAVYSDTGEVVKFDGSNRLKVMMEIIFETKQKVIVFVQFGHAIDIVNEHIQVCGYSTEVIRGSVSAGNRARIIREFQREEHPRVLVIQPQSAAHGVTLTAASDIIWFGPTNSVETWLQANERINRPSQEHKMTVHKLCGSEVERKVYNVLESKHRTQRDLVSLYEDEVGLT